MASMLEYLRGEVEEKVHNEDDMRFYSNRIGGVENEES